MVSALLIISNPTGINADSQPTQSTANAYDASAFSKNHGDDDLPYEDIWGANKDDAIQPITWNVTYGDFAPIPTVASSGSPVPPKRVLLINGQFPGPEIDTTTNVNLLINVFNSIDEPLLFTW